MSKELPDIDLRQYAISDADRIIAGEYWLGDSSEKRASDQSGLARHAVRTRLAVMRARAAVFQSTAIPRGSRVVIETLGGRRKGTVSGRVIMDRFLEACEDDAQKQDWYHVILDGNGHEVAYLRSSLNVIG